MADNKQRLELTWVGKGKEPRLEPRILIEDAEKSYGDKQTENMLIHGDNLLALKALEQDFSGRIKCIYIDPPFNTFSAFENYDDGLEHSIWLNLMYQRIDFFYKLLHKDGCIFIHLDDNELDYCKVIMDEIFGRRNFINRITIDARSPSAFSTVNPGVFKASEYVLWYAKDKVLWESRSLRIPDKRDLAYNKFILNRELSTDEWEFKSLKIVYLEKLNEDKLETIKSFIRKVFVSQKGKQNKEIVSYVVENFSLAPLVEAKKLANYLKDKLMLSSFEEFESYTYPYLLEKTSYNFSDKDLDLFVFENAASICRETEISDSGAGKETVELKYTSLQEPEKIFKLDRGNGLDTIYVYGGRQISFYDKNVNEVDGLLTATKLLTNIWTDIAWEGIAKEGGVKFKKGKKPEKLLERVLLLTTNKDDFVLDSFLGSGTTAAAAHKMGRKWIGVEIGEHAITHCQPRLKRVVDGLDSSGISKSQNWKGGGGFKFYNLAPSLLKKDDFGNWVIDTSYNADMLAAAMAKHEGYHYSPHEQLFWKQGQSTEQDFIFTTTQFVTVQLLDKIHEQMKDGESLLVCCKSYQEACERKYDNINIKKIPNMLLGRCEFGKEDYSLNIISMPTDENEEPFVPAAQKITKEKEAETMRKQGKQPELFD